MVMVIVMRSTLHKFEKKKLANVGKFSLENLHTSISTVKLKKLKVENFINFYYERNSNYKKF